MNQLLQGSTDDKILAYEKYLNDISSSLSKNFVNLPPLVVILHPVLPSFSQLNGGDALLKVSVDVVLKELLHHQLSDLSLHVP